MHVLETVRTDVRVLRKATALVEAGMDVSIVDIEDGRTRPCEEDLDGIHLKHIVMPSWFVPARIKPWFLVKVARMLVYGTLALLKTPADVYHAHDDTALPACYIAARLRRKLLVFYDVRCIVPSLEPEMIGRAINAMLADRDALARMRSNALAATRHDLCWERESQRLIELYEDIMEGIG